MTSTTSTTIDNPSIKDPKVQPSTECPLTPTSRIGRAIILMPDTGEGLDTLTPPLGTLAIAAYLESKGLPILHLDQRVEPNVKQIIMDCVREGALCIGMGLGTGVGHGVWTTWR